MKVLYWLWVWMLCLCAGAIIGSTMRPLGFEEWQIALSAGLAGAAVAFCGAVFARKVHD